MTAPRRPRGRGRAGRVASSGLPVDGQLRSAVARELNPQGCVEEFLCARIVDALEAYDRAVPRDSFRVDPKERLQEEVVEELFSALAQLRAMQTHRRAKSSGSDA